MLESSMKKNMIRRVATTDDKEPLWMALIDSLRINLLVFLKAFFMRCSWYTSAMATHQSATAVVTIQMVVGTPNALCIRPWVTPLLTMMPKSYIAPTNAVSVMSRSTMETTQFLDKV